MLCRNRKRSRTSLTSTRRKPVRARACSDGHANRGFPAGMTTTKAKARTFKKETIDNGKDIPRPGRRPIPYSGKASGHHRLWIAGTRACVEPEGLRCGGEGGAAARIAIGEEGRACRAGGDGGA